MTNAENILEETKDLFKLAWIKGRTVDGVNPDMFRKDACGAWICFNKFKNEDSNFGWDIDYILPKNKGGDERKENIRPLNIRNIRSRNEKYPCYVSCFTSYKEDNIHKVSTKCISNRKQEELRVLYNLK